MCVTVTTVLQTLEAIRYTLSSYLGMFVKMETRRIQSLLRLDKAWAPYTLDLEDQLGASLTENKVLRKKLEEEKKKSNLLIEDLKHVLLQKEELESELFIERMLIPKVPKKRGGCWSFWLKPACLTTCPPT